MLRLWQELHEMNPDLDRRGSKNSFFPNSTIAGLVTVCGSIFWIGSSLEAATETSATRNTLAAVISNRVGMMDLAAATRWFGDIPPITHRLSPKTRRLAHDDRIS
jgi:hypothetical protein